MSELAKTIWELGAEYDARKNGPQRHLSIYAARGFIVAAWESAENDVDRLHALDRDETTARAKLAGRIWDSIKPQK
jgi:hypothetical protein